ncbi:MAG: hypothetical protein J07HX64_01397 [halophilic archaeon J07HX64]|nr:MAG: hypothetical protein J07HX64_01397 [halophilic archaeon J07HX64]
MLDDVGVCREAIDGVRASDQSDDTLARAVALYTGHSTTGHGESTLATHCDGTTTSGESSTTYIT